MRIGIVVAEEEEMLAVKEIMQDIVEHKKYDLNFFEGEIEKNKCILTRGRVRKSK